MYAFFSTMAIPFIPHNKYRTNGLMCVMKTKIGNLAPDNS